MDKIENNESFLPYLFISGEAHFHLDGHVNSKNNNNWGTEPPNEVVEKPLHSQKVTAWCALSTMLGCIGPFFFEAKGATVTITAERYIEVLISSAKNWQHDSQVIYQNYGSNKMERHHIQLS